MAKAKGESPKDYDLSAADKLIYGAAPLCEDMARMLIDAYGTQNFYQVYGMTETGPAGAVLKPADQVRKAGSIGKGGMLGVDLKVIDDHGHDVEAGGEGEIWMRTDSVMEVYMSNPRDTAEAFIDGWYRTGDIGRVDEDGYVYVIDRKKDIIITGGENVASREVEEVLSAHPDVSQVAVVGATDERWGEAVCAVVVPAPGAELDTDELIRWTEDRLARFKRPKRVLTLREMPTNASGKVDKRRIRELLGDTIDLRDGDGGDDNDGERVSAAPGR